MAARVEGWLAAGIVVGAILVCIAQPLGPTIGPVAWLAGGLLLLVSFPSLLLLGAITLIGRPYRMRTWRPTQPPDVGQAQFERQLASSRDQQRATKMPGEPGTSWSRPLLLGNGRFVPCSTLEATISVNAGLDRAAQAVMAALVSPGWEASAADTAADAQHEVIHVTRAPAGPIDRDATYLGQEAVGGLTRSPRVIVRTSLRRAGAASTTVTLSGACSGALWGERRAAEHLADVLQTLCDRITTLADVEAGAR